MESISGKDKKKSHQCPPLTFCRLKEQCATFLINSGLIKSSSELFCSSPPVDAPFWICSWIMSKCDEITLDGKHRPHNEFRDSYAQAQKMRAAMTHVFTRDYNLGSVQWHESELVPGRMMGNPSVSSEVANYMSGLRRRKVI